MVCAVSAGVNGEVFSVLQTTATTAEFEYCSPAGEMGYPGTLYAKVIYEVDGGSLRLRCAQHKTRNTHQNAWTAAKTPENAFSDPYGRILLYYPEEAAKNRAFSMRSRTADTAE